MGRARSPNREEAKKIYMMSKGKIKLVDIAKQLDVTPGQIRQWKKKDQWENILNGVPTIAPPVVIKKDNVPTKPKASKKSNTPKKKPQAKKPQVKKRPGGKPGNQNARKHGLYAKYLPTDTIEIVNAIECRGPIDFLYDSIVVTYANIIRSQKIMYVKDINDMTKELKKEKESTGEFSNSWEKEYNIQFAWDKQASMLQALARATTSLNIMIKQYEDMCNNFNKEKREEYAAKLAKLKVETDNIQKQKADTVINYYSNIPQPKEGEG